MPLASKTTRKPSLKVKPKRIHRIVLTGGACGGKSSSLAVLEQRLTNRGFRVLIVPESATLVLGMGVRPYGIDGPPRNRRKSASYSGDEFQETLIASAMVLEKAASEYAERLIRSGPEDVVIIYDRGIPDGLAYMDKARFEKLLLKHGTTSEKLMTVHYDHVFHLVTAAIGTDAYSNETNLNRRETKEEAIELDTRTRNAWVGCEHFGIIDNSTGFDEKIDRLYAAVCHALGIPVPIEDEIKLLVEPVTEIPVHYRVADITQMYLRSAAKKERRIRTRTLAGHSAYFLTEKSPNADGEGRIELQRMISGREFFELAGLRDLNFNPIQKKRALFATDDSHYFELDHAFAHDPNLWLLECERMVPGQNIIVPPWIKVIADVTHDPQYKNRNMARVGKN